MTAAGRLLPARDAGLFTALRERGWLMAAGLVLATALLMRLTVPTNEDVSWLIELGGRTLAGARPYVDFIEVNPPAAILLYMPAVWLAHLLALRPETVTDGLVVAGALVSLALAGRILARAGLLPAATGKPLLAIGLAVLLVVPAYTFAERDDIAVLAALPGLATLAVRRHGVRPDPLATALAGLGFGLVVAIKPMFALALAAPAALLLARSGVRALAAAWELWVGAVVAGTYGAGTLLLVPAFAERVLPLAVAIYVPRRLPWPALLTVVMLSSLPVLLVMLRACARRWPVGPVPAMLASASVGFAGVFLLQGKGFAYHRYPAVSLALLATAFAVLEARRHASLSPASAARPLLGFAAVLLLAGFAETVTFNRRFDPFRYAPALGPAIQALAPHPRLIALSSILSLGQPYARALGGQWVGSAPFPFISSDAQRLIDRNGPSPALTDAIAADQARFADDIRHGTPDAVLVDGAEWQDWIDRSPALTAAMADYRRSGPPFNSIQLWVRRTPRPAETTP